VPADRETTRKPLAVWGAKGPALIVADIVQLCGQYDIIGYLDNLNPERKGTRFGGATVLGGEEALDELWEAGVRHIIFAFQNNPARLRLAERVKARGFELASAIHPTASIAAGAQIGAGTVVRALSAVGPETQIGENCIIGYGVMISHNCVIEDGVHLSSGVNVAGTVRVGRATWVGMGATIIDPKSIGSHSIVGAGSLVTRDVPSNVVSYGVPAKVVRDNPQPAHEMT